MLDEGYIKYQSDWIKSTPLPYTAIQELNFWRAKLYQLGLLGAYANGIGFGNISQRWGTQDGLFVISGSTTGNRSARRATLHTRYRSHGRTQFPEMQWPHYRFLRVYESCSYL